MWPIAPFVLLGAGIVLGFLARQWLQETPDNSPDLSQRLMSVLPALQEYGIAKAETASRQEFCKLLLANACRLGQTEHGTVLMWDETQGALQTIASTAAKSEEGFLEEPPEKIAERVLKSSEPILLSWGSGKAFVSIPIMAQSKPFGVLQLELKRHPNRAEMQALTLLAGEGAAIFHELSLFERLQAFHMEMVETLHRAVNALDANANDHVNQTRLRARKLAQAMKLPDTMVRHVEYASLLRGIGKIGVDQAILKKPGKLTPDEYEEIKKHTTIGHRLLAQVQLLAPAAKMVLYHQEWFNGRGYPEGLQGENIPIGARIIAVIATWEAMTTNRPYRKAFAPDEALAEIQRAAGTQFDPAVVEAFRRIQQL